MNTRSCLILILAGAVVAPAVPGQSKCHIRTIPGAFAGTFANNQLDIPAGWPGIYQVWYRGDTLRGLKTINEFGLRGPQDFINTAGSMTVDVVLDNSKLTFASMSGTVTANLSANAVTFMKTKTVNWTAASRDPNQASMWFKGDRPFQIAGPHLVAQVRGRASVAARFDKIQMTNLDTWFGEHGAGCGPARLTSIYTNGIVLSTVSGLAPKAPALFLVGDNSVRFGPACLPIDLSPLGATGCTLDLVPLIETSAVADNAGNATLAVPFKLPLDALVMHVQAVYLTTANAAGYQTTNATVGILGKRGLTNSLVAWGTRTIYGPHRHNEGVVALIR